MKWYCLSLHARAEQGDANNLKMVHFLTVAAKHCRQAEHSLSRFIPIYRDSSGLQGASIPARREGRSAGLSPGIKLMRIGFLEDFLRGAV
jgi:hypothetical protein